MDFVDNIEFIEEINFEDCLILEVQSNTILYDLSDINYNNQRKKDAIWEKISENCSRSVNECKKRWKSLRDRFRYLYSKENNTTSGQVSTKKIEWQYYDALKFLIPTIIQAPAFSNYNESSSSSERRVESSSSSSYTAPASTTGKRRKDELEDSLLQYLQTPEEEIDSDKNFALSLVDTLKSLSREREKNALARIKIQQILYNLKYDKF